MNTAIKLLLYAIGILLVGPIVVFAPISTLWEYWYLMYIFDLILIFFIVIFIKENRHLAISTIIFILIGANLILINLGTEFNYSNNYAIFYHVAMICGMPFYFFLVSRLKD